MDRGSGRGTYERWMRRALALARRAEGDVGHYPMVGAVLLKGGRVVAEGFFRKPGAAHAEAEAIRKAGSRARGATLVLNLEPCCHYGRTPPCTDAIIGAGIRRVVAGMKDPNPLVNGKGFRKLRRAGVDVVTGVLEQECRRLNEVFVKYISTGRPFVILKAASTLDGMVADRRGRSKWITGKEARTEVHRLRDLVDVVMVGAGTVIADDPLLTARLAGKGRHPRPLVVDSRLRISEKSRIFRTPAEGGLIVATTTLAPERKRKLMEKAGAEVMVVKRDADGVVDLKALMRRLGKKKIAGVLLEGGPGIFTSALEAGIVDKVIIFISPKLLLDGKARHVTESGRARSLERALLLSGMSAHMVGDDLMITGYPG